MAIAYSALCGSCFSMIGSINVFCSFCPQAKKSKIESSDILINTDSIVRFSFNIDALDIDAYADGYVDAYDGYDDFDDLFGVDEIFISSDRLRYIVDSGKSEADRRFSIFKDGKGFLNFRIFDDSLHRKNEVGMYNVATNIKHFIPGELHHIGASWKLNTLDEKDENMTMVTVDEMTDGVSGIKGLLDITSAYANITLTSFDVTLTVTGYGTPLAPQLVKGLIAGDFTLFNVTDSLSVAIISATEDTAGGTYAITYAAQDTTEVLKLTPSKNGYNFSAVVTNTITLP